MTREGTTMTSPAAFGSAIGLLRLLQLASPALPVGAYSYSQGLESAVEAAVVRDEESAALWIEGVLSLVIARFEGPILVRMLGAVDHGGGRELRSLNAVLLAGRETAELRAETVQMGRSLRRLLGELAVAHPILPALSSLDEPSYPCAWACAAAAFAVPPCAAYPAYLWAWAENQVLAAVKLVPLGQSAGQRMLLRLAEPIARLAAHGRIDDDSLTNFAPGLAIASSRHETQYSRLFRS